MLIIFDLDDTLIQTSKYITPWKFERVLKNIEAKQTFDLPLNRMLEDLISEHQSFESSSIALKDFFKKKNISPMFLEESLLLLQGFDQHLPVHLFEGVQALLDNLKKDFKLVCVTSGIRDVQLLKLQKAGLDKIYFDDIFIVEDGDKTKAYKDVLEKHHPSGILVVGDRIVKDLIPAKNLGFFTVLVRQGRGKFQEIDKTLIDFVIQDVTEVADLIKSIQNI